MANLEKYTPIYVRTTGNDSTGDGSSGNPYLTAQKAFEVAYAGTGLKVLDFGAGDFLGVDIASVGQDGYDWPSRIAVRGVDSQSSILGGIIGAPHKISIISDKTVEIGEISGGSTVLTDCKAGKVNSASISLIDSDVVYINSSETTCSGKAKGLGGGNILGLSKTEKVSLLLHMDGRENSTIFTDCSIENKHIKVKGNTRIKESKCFFDGNGSYLETKDEKDFGFGRGDFTIESKIYIPYDGWGTTGTIFNLGGKIKLRTYGAESLVINGETYNWYPDENIPIDQEAHIAMTRKGGEFNIFVNGERVFQLTGVSADLGRSNMLRIGAWEEDGMGAFYLYGYLKEFRVIKGRAVYSGEFLPPTEALSVIVEDHPYLDSRTLYFNNIANDNSWTNLNNWWVDEEHTVQSTSLPGENDKVVVRGAAFDGINVTVRKLTMFADGNVPLRTSFQNSTINARNGIFAFTTEAWTPTPFIESGGSGFASTCTLNGNVFFFESDPTQGTMAAHINGNLVIGGCDVNQNAYVSGSVILTGDNGNYANIGGNLVSAYATNGSPFAGVSPTIQGNAIFIGPGRPLSGNWGVVNGNAEFYTAGGSPCVNVGTVQGDAYFYDSSNGGTSNSNTTFVSTTSNQALNFWVDPFNNDVHFGTINGKTKIYGTGVVGGSGSFFDDVHLYDDVILTNTFKPPLIEGNIYCHDSSTLGSVACNGDVFFYDNSHGNMSYSPQLNLDWLYNTYGSPDWEGWTEGQWRPINPLDPPNLGSDFFVGSCTLYGNSTLGDFLVLNDLTLNGESGMTQYNVTATTGGDQGLNHGVSESGTRVEGRIICNTTGDCYPDILSLTVNADHTGYKKFMVGGCSFVKVNYGNAYTIEGSWPVDLGYYIDTFGITGTRNITVQPCDQDGNPTWERISSFISYQYGVQSIGFITEVGSLRGMNRMGTLDVLNIQNTELDVLSLKSLETLRISGPNITSVNVSGLINLSSVSLFANGGTPSLESVLAYGFGTWAGYSGKASFRIIYDYDNNMDITAWVKFFESLGDGTAGGYKNYIMAMTSGCTVQDAISYMINNHFAWEASQGGPGWYIETGSHC
jgi:hypothetical protein